jgi:hypothetical protein
MGEYELGTPFGILTHSPQVDSARSKHNECINEASKTLAAYVNASKVLVAAIERIRQNYASSDALAAGDGRVVTETLNQALKDAEAARAGAASTMANMQEAARHGCPVHVQSTEGSYTMNTEPTTHG